MKKYKEYMDSVRASDTLHQRLLGLEADGKRPIPWKKYGTVAAALALVVGLGGWGMAHGGWNALADRFQPNSRPEIAELDGPDIAIVEPGDVTEPGEKTLGGYDVTIDGCKAITTHYILPYIEYGGTGGSEAATQIAADWDIPQGATRRDLTRDEIAALMGGEDVLSTHLDWGEYELTGWAAWYEDGSFWGAYIDGIVPNYGAALNSFEFAVTAGQLPPTCYGYPSSVTQEVRGLTINAVKYCTPTAVSVPAGANAPEWTNLVVSFMKDDYGYRFEMSSTDAQQAELLVSRLVRLMADQGIGQLDWDGTYTCSICGRNFPVGSAHGHPFLGVGEPNWEDGVPDQDTSAYDPREAADPSYNAPATHTCEICGEVYPEGTAHSHEVCGLPLAPGTHTCEVCGEAVPEGMAHDCAATHICEVCGQTLPAGMEHSHQEDHHQDHHSGHH